MEALFPAEVMTDVPRITVTGCSCVHVEQHKGLVAYQQDEVTFRTGCGMVKITGRELGFKLYTACEATITGSITGVAINGNGGGKA